MDNLFSTNKEIHIIYDLKGSIIGRRELSEESNKDFKFDRAAYAVKDLDLEDQKKHFLIGDKKDKIMNQMKNDTEFLKKNNIIDYSLLVGIHINYIEKNLKSEIPFNCNINPANPFDELVGEKNKPDGSIEQFSENSILNYELNYTETERNQSFEKEKHPFKDVLIFFNLVFFTVIPHLVYHG